MLKNNTYLTLDIRVQWDCSRTNFCSRTSILVREQNLFPNKINSEQVANRTSRYSRTKTSSCTKFCSRITILVREQKHVRKRCDLFGNTSAFGNNDTFANNHTCSRIKSCSEIKILFGNKKLSGNENLFANKYSCSRLKPVREQVEFPNKWLSRTTLFFRPKFVREQKLIREQDLVREQLFLQSSFPNKNSLSNKSENKAIHEQKLYFTNKISNFRTNISFNGHILECTSSLLFVLRVFI